VFSVLEDTSACVRRLGILTKASRRKGLVHGGNDGSREGWEASGEADVWD